MSQTRVLVVEDEGLIARDLASRLQKGGYEIAGITSSGEEALECVAKRAPDLVLMDIFLNGNMDGIEAAQRMRTDFHIPVIFTSAYSDRETQTRAQRAEPFGYLVKSLHQANLISTIEMALYHHRHEAESASA